MYARALLVIVLLGLVAGAIYLAIDRFEGTPPALEAPEQIVLGKTAVPLAIELRDDESGLRSVSVRLLHEAGSQSLLEQSYPGSAIGGGTPDGRQKTAELVLDVATLRVPDGAATIVVSARDWSLRDGFAGNRTERSIPLTIDTRPPSVSLRSGLTYVYRGGSAAAVYHVAEEAPWDGIRVGETLYRGFPHPSGENGARVAIFAIPVDAAKHTPVSAVAIDEAGNQGHVSFPANVRERPFVRSTIALDEDFLARVAVPLAESAGERAATPAAAFQWVNTELRARSERTIRERLAESAPEALWKGSFQQMRGSQVMSRFAEHRFYTLGGREISQARHFGFDLASTSRAPVTASAEGVVAAAEEIGIYGKCVLIDHGLGLASLYGHLSQIDVTPGETVTKDQPIGLSGATGLAGGDHLHFAILVGDTYVDPLEWWDPKWVRSHVAVRLERSTR